MLPISPMARKTFSSSSPSHMNDWAKQEKTTPMAAWRCALVRSVRCGEECEAGGEGDEKS
jgi:hypothetical protein